jgi:hypothetical protein
MTEVLPFMNPNPLWGYKYHIKIYI